MNNNFRSVLIQTNSLSLGYGGGFTGLISICQAFGRNESIKTSLISFDNELSSNDQFTIGSQLREIKNIYLKEYLFRIPTFFSFLRLIREIANNDVIYVHSLNSFFSLVTFIISKTLFKKVLFRPHGSLMKVYTKKFNKIKHLFTFFQLLIYRNADLIILSSELELIELKRYDVLNLINPKKIKVIYESLGINFKKISDCKPFKSREIDFLYVGRINKEKGIFEFLDFLNTFFEKNSLAFKKIFRIVITGPSEKNYKEILENYISQFKKFKNVDIKYTGYIDNDLRNQFYQNTKYFLYPTYGDCFGLSVVEALYFGCRVISTKDLGIYKILKSLNLIDIYKRDHDHDKKLILKILKEKENINYSVSNKKLDKYFGFDEYTKNYKYIINSFLN